MPMNLSPEQIQMIQRMLQQGGGAGNPAPGGPPPAMPPMGGPAGPGPMAPMPGMGGPGVMTEGDLSRMQGAMGGGAPPPPMPPGGFREPPNGMGIGAGAGAGAAGGADPRQALIEAILKRQQGQMQQPAGRY